MNLRTLTIAALAVPASMFVIQQVAAAVPSEKSITANVPGCQPAVVGPTAEAGAPASETGNEVPTVAVNAATTPAGGRLAALFAAFVGVPLLVVGCTVLAWVAMRGTRAGRRRRTGAVPEEAYSALLGHALPDRTSASKLTRPVPDIESVAVPPRVDKSGYGWLRLLANGHSRSHPVNGYDVTVGFAPDCDLVLPAGSTSRRERVRVWQRDGRFMLQNLTRGGDVRVAEKAVDWTVLDDGDPIEIAGWTVRFEGPSGEAGEATHPTPNAPVLGPMCPGNPA